MGTAKWRLWRYNLKIWARKREGERRSDLNDTNFAWLAGGRCGRRGEGLADFFQLTAFFSGVFPSDFASKLSVQLLRGTENTSRYVNRCGYQQMKNNVCSKMPPTANRRIFLHKPIAGSLTWTAFPRGWVPLVPLEMFLQKTKGKVQENWLSLLDQKTWQQLCLCKRKTYLFI